MTIKRTKELDRILEQMGLYFNPSKTQKVIDHIELLEGRIKHLEQVISEWQEATGQEHPTLEGF